MNHTKNGWKGEIGLPNKSGVFDEEFAKEN